MTQYSEAQKKLMLASFDLGQAQRALEDAEERWRKALDEVEKLECQIYGEPLSNGHQGGAT
jgi:hypothetical protein